MRLISSAIERLGLALSALAMTALTLMMLQICADVVGRFAFSRPLPSTIEIVAEWWMPALIFLPMVFVENQRDNITVDLLYDQLGRRGKLTLDMFANAIFTIFLVFLAWASGEQALRAYEDGDYIVGMIPVTTWPTRFFLPTAAILVAILTSLRFVESLISLVSCPNDKIDEGSFDG